LLQRLAIDPSLEALGVGVGQRTIEGDDLAINRGDLILLGFEVLGVQAHEVVRHRDQAIGFT
jgi:hypothetical protein